MIIRRLDMDSKKLRIALSKSKDITLNFLARALSSTRVEPIQDEDGVKGIKASWLGESGEHSVDVDTGQLNAIVSLETEEPPSVEYVEHGDSRSVAIKNINNLRCSVDQETLDEFTSPRGAAIAVCAGAAVGLVGWFAISVMRAITVSVKEQEQSLEQSESEDTEAAD